MSKKIRHNIRFIIWMLTMIFPIITFLVALTIVES